MGLVENVESQKKNKCIKSCCTFVPYFRKHWEKSCSVIFAAKCSWYILQVLRAHDYSLLILVLKPKLDIISLNSSDHVYFHIFLTDTLTISSLLWKNIILFLEAGQTTCPLCIKEKKPSHGSWVRVNQQITIFHFFLIFCFHNYV